jgi:hypothetical protein
MPRAPSASSLSVHAGKLPNVRAVPSNLRRVLRRPRQGETLKGGRVRSFVTWTARDIHTTPHKHAHKRMRMDTHAHVSCATDTPEYPCKPCHSAALKCAHMPKQLCMQPHATRHLFLVSVLSLLFLVLYLLLHPKPNALSHALIFRRCAQYLPLNHAFATIVPAPCCSRACCPLRTSRYIACHARRR